MVAFDRLYVYIVGIVLVLGLVMPFDAQANGLNICINGVSLSGQSCGNTQHQPSTMRRNTKAYNINGAVAQHILLNLHWHNTTATHGISANGSMHSVGRYKGAQYPEIQDRIFSCTVTPNGKNFNCKSWPVL